MALSNEAREFEARECAALRHGARGRRPTPLEAHRVAIFDHLQECEALLQKVRDTIAEGPYPDNPVWDEIASGIAALLGPAATEEKTE